MNITITADALITTVAIATYKIDGYTLDGVKVMLNGNANHFPVGTHVEVAILCEV